MLPWFPCSSSIFRLPLSTSFPSFPSSFVVYHWNLCRGDFSFLSLVVPCSAGSRESRGKINADADQRHLETNRCHSQLSSKLRMKLLRCDGLMGCLLCRCLPPTPPPPFPLSLSWPLPFLPLFGLPCSSSTHVVACALLSLCPSVTMLAFI